MWFANRLPFSRLGMKLLSAWTFMHAWEQCHALLPVGLDIAGLNESK